MVLPRTLREAPDAHDALRRFWAQHCMWSSHEQRDWPSMPPDVMRMVMSHLDGPSVAATRRACKAWWAAANTAVQDLDVRSWPAVSVVSVLHHFTSLRSLALRGPFLEEDATRLALLGPLLVALAQLPALQRLEMAYPGPGALENLDILRGLTSLSLSRSQQPRSMLLSGGQRLPDLLQQEDNVAAELEDLQYRAAAQAAGPPGEEAAGAEAGGEPVVGLAGAAAAGAAQIEQPPQQQQQQGLFGLADGLGGGGVALLAAPAVGNGGASSSSSSGSGRRSSTSGRSSYDMPSLPAALSRLRTLRELRLDNMVPCYSTLAPLTHLEALELRGQTLRPRGGLLVASSPLPGVGALTGLTRLVARCNYGINRLPAEVGRLGRLRALDLTKNMLWALPTELLELTGLESLDVSSNCLSALPEDLYRLTALTRLDVSNNSRIVLPASLGQLHSLKELTLNWVWSDLGPVWEGSTGLSRLEVLSVIGNGVASLPPSVGGFKKLRSLSLSMNNLTHLPPEMGSLTALSTLEISDNRLAALPPTLGRLSSLTHLSLRSNALGALPAEVGQLTALNYLDVSMNHLGVLPPTMSCLVGLQQLALSMNPLTSLPEGLEALQQLKILEMYYVSLTAEDVLHLAPAPPLVPAAAAAGMAGVVGDADVVIADVFPGAGPSTAAAAGGGSAAAATSAAMAAADNMAAWSKGPLRRLQDKIPGLYVFSNTPISGSDRGSSDSDSSPRGGLEARIESLLEQQLHPVVTQQPAAASSLVLGGDEEVPAGAMSPAWGSGVTEEDSEEEGAAASPMSSQASDINLQELMMMLTVPGGVGEDLPSNQPAASHPAGVPDVTRDTSSDAPSTPRKPKGFVSSSSSPASRPSPGGASSSSWSPSSSGSDIASSSRGSGGRDQAVRRISTSPDNSSSWAGSNRAPRPTSLACTSTTAAVGVVSPRVHSVSDVTPAVWQLPAISAAAAPEVSLSARWAARRAARQEEGGADDSWLGSRPERRWTRYDDEGAR